MKILFNLAPLKEGGGLNVALNFVKCLMTGDYDLSSFLFVVVRGTSLEALLKSNPRCNVISVSWSPIKRMVFEILNGRKIVRKHGVDIIYSLFGIGLYSKKIPQISGAADSNLFYPEIDFWQDSNGLGRFGRMIVDRYRLYGLTRAHAVIFENLEMMKRSKSLLGLKEVVYSKPSINPDFPDGEIDLPEIPRGVKIGLFLCGWHKNKNYMMIPHILKKFREKGRNFHIFITAPRSDSQSFNEFSLSARNAGVFDMVTVLNPVNKTQLRKLYEQIDYVFLLSRLESFSNNIIESWFFKKPLIITDADWSRSICKDAAIYVDRDSVNDIVGKICEMEDDNLKKDHLIKCAQRELEKYPSIQDKVNTELAYIQKIYESF